jgi:pyridoxal phosphate enzyme (YggS family)
MPPLFNRLQENLRRVRGRIEAAARRSGREPEDVTLVAVTKYVGPETAHALCAAGCCELGESRPQELWRKAEALADLPIRWHLVGHLQRNKVRRTLPLVRLIHSLDSLRLARALDDEARLVDLRVPVLLEINVGGETAKTGLHPDTVEPLLADLAGLRRLEVRGLMTLAALGGGLAEARRDFAALRALRDRLLPRCPQGIALKELSMGMSGDFEAAIEEGATIVRVGSALFEGIEGEC